MKIDDLNQTSIEQVLAMTDLQIESGDKTPFVHLNMATGQLKFEGRSIPENAQEFYRPLLAWIEHYLSAPMGETVLFLNLEYFNTSSSKIILEMMMKLKRAHDRGAKVLVKWLYHEEDEEMEEAGNDYASLLDIPFDIIPYS